MAKNSQLTMASAAVSVTLAAAVPFVVFGYGFGII
jgi:hypothetical protein